MNSHRRLLLAMCSLLAMLTLPGCARLLGSLDVDLQAIAECKRLAEQDQPIPQIQGADFRVLSAEALAALRKEREAKHRHLKCDERVVERYKKGG